jgi:MoaA/NifB/PqqE/SkfB family radical SAM enzyme
MERPASGLRARKRQLAAQFTAFKNFIFNRRLHREGREDFRPLYFIWTTLRDCNFRCSYCDDHRGRRYPDLPKEGTLDTEQGLKLLRIMRTRTPSLYYAGGEPTLREDLPELTRAAWNMDYFPITINTNGSLLHRQLAKPAWRRWLADMDIIVVSLDRLDTEALKNLWNYGNPDNVVRNLLMLQELREEMQFKLMVNTVIQPGLVQHARAVLDLVNDLGITFCAVPINIGPRIHPELKDDQDYRALTGTILDRKRGGYPIVGSLRLNERLLTSAPLDCRNTLKPHVDYDGRVYWPCKSTVNVPPEKINVLDFDHLDQLYSHGSKLIEPTRFHGPARNQCGGDCNWAQNYTTDAYVHGLENPLSLVAEILKFSSRR